MITPADADKVLDQNANLTFTKALRLLMGRRSLNLIQSICTSLTANITLNMKNVIPFLLSNAAEGLGFQPPCKITSLPRLRGWPAQNAIASARDRMAGTQESSFSEFWKLENPILSNSPISATNHVDDTQKNRVL